MSATLVNITYTPYTNTPAFVDVAGFITLVEQKRINLAKLLVQFKSASVSCSVTYESKLCKLILDRV